jgi:hypothetical protein
MKPQNQTVAIRFVLTMGILEFIKIFSNTSTKLITFNKWSFCDVIRTYKFITNKKYRKIAIK